MRPSFLSVATKPKWVGALVVALLAAAVCAMLGQWQLSRSIRITPEVAGSDSIVQLGTITNHGQAVTGQLADRHVTTTIKVQNQNCFIINDRRQLVEDGTTTPGFWVVTDSIDTLGAHIFLAHGFTKSIDTATQACETQRGLTEKQPFQPVIGRYEPSEEPQPQTSATLSSFSVPQLININQPKPIASYQGFIVLDSSGLDPRLDRIKIGIKSSQSQINLLNTFYAIEWAVFAGFALFLWYRLIQDERDRLRDEES